MKSTDFLEFQQDKYSWLDVVGLSILRLFHIHLNYMD